METQILDQIISNSSNTLDDQIMELEQAPENFVNVLFDKSYDEMKDKEQRDAIQAVGQYLMDNEK